MGRNKLERFRQNEANANVVQPGKENFEKIKGNWKSVQFKSNAPLVVELACGRGEFTVGQARVDASKNFVGVDIKGSRIWKGSTIAIAEGLENVAFLRTQIELLEDSFEEKEIDELWITFPDPRPKDRDERKRLTSPKFLEMYKKSWAGRGMYISKQIIPDFMNTLSTCLKVEKTLSFIKIRETSTNRNGKTSIMVL